MGRQVFDTENKYEINLGFSNRLNQLLDRCDFPPLGDGRGRELIAFFNISKGSASAWLTKDKPPVWATLNTLIEKLIEHYKLDLSQDRVIAWLLHSNEVIENPLDGAMVPRSRRLLDAVIYSELERLATEHKVDIYSFDNEQFTELYDKALEHFLQNKISSHEEIRAADKLILAGYILLAKETA